MKNYTKTYGEFLNEMGGYGPPKDPIDSLVNRIVSSKNFKKQDFTYYREQLKWALSEIGVTGKITIKNLIAHPKFDELEEIFKDVIYSMGGSGKRSPNQNYIKAFAAGLKNFDITNDADKEGIIYNAIYFKDALKSKNYPTTYTGFTSIDRQALNNTIKGYDITKTLEPEELKFIQKMIKPKYEADIKRFLTDDKFEDMMKFMFKKFVKDESDEDRFLNINFQKNLPKFLKYIKDLLLKNNMDDKKWKSLKVKLNFSKSENGPVSSSSFSTYYYYNVEATIAGKKFKAKDVLIGSSYYSGGWG